MKTLFPPASNFYQILGINTPPALSDTSSSDQANPPFRDVLFDSFKVAPKSPDVSLAYTVLRNPQLKSQYDWMIENNMVMMKMTCILACFRNVAKPLLKQLSERFV